VRHDRKASRNDFALTRCTAEAHPQRKSHRGCSAPRQISAIQTFEAMNFDAVLRGTPFQSLVFVVEPKSYCRQPFAKQGRLEMATRQFPKRKAVASATLPNFTSDSLFLLVRMNPSP
jgi:hypothetical protein